MKNIVKLFLAVTLVTLVLASCAGSAKVIDPNIPEENLAKIQFIYIKIDSYNGINVDNFQHVKIPMGNSSFTGKATIPHGGINFVFTAEFSFGFEGGKSYVIEGAARDMLWGVLIYEAESYGKANKDNLIAFIPFKDQPEL